MGRFPELRAGEECRTPGWLAAGVLLLAAAVPGAAVEVVVDNSDPGFSILSGTWNSGNSATPFGADYRWRATVTGSPTGEVQWRPHLPTTATYDVFVWYVQGSNRSTDAPYTVDHAAGSTTVPLNQQTNGSQWEHLGSYPFLAGTAGRIRLNNSASPSVVVADAVRFRTNAAPPLNADLDADRDVDGDDFAFFQACLTGPNAGPAAPACGGTDFDGDDDIDQEDFGTFQCCLSGPAVQARADCLVGPIPPRPAEAVSGSRFVQQVWSLPTEIREQMVLAEMTAGNIPPFLRKSVPVTVTATLGSTVHTATYFVMPDCLAVGSDADFVRFPMGPLTAQAVADTFHCIMPTRKMVDDIYTAAAVKLAPYPFSPAVYNIESVEVFNLSNTKIEEQRAAAGGILGALIGGTKKDVVITPQLAVSPGKVAIYGWHQLNGQPIQPLYLGHVITYMDYSHGIRLVRQIMLVDGQPQYIQDVLRDPVLCQLLSDEGALNDPRYYDLTR